MPHSLDDDAIARAINAQPWEPLPGMTKLRCGRCHYWFAARDPIARRCVDCEIVHQRKLRIEAARAEAAD